MNKQNKRNVEGRKGDEASLKYEGKKGALEKEMLCDTPDLFTLFQMHAMFYLDTTGGS